MFMRVCIAARLCSADFIGWPPKSPTANQRPGIKREFLYTLKTVFSYFHHSSVCCQKLHRRHVAAFSISLDWGPIQPAFVGFILLK